MTTKIPLKICAFVMSALLVSFTPVDAFAASSSSIKAELARAMDKRDELARAVSAAGAQLQDTEAMLDQTKAQMADTQNQIDQKQADLQQKQAQLAARTSANYKAGATSLLSLILESTSFENLCSNLYYANKISQADQAAIAEVVQAKSELEAQQNALATLEAEQQQLYNDQASQSNALKEQQAKQEDYINSLSSDLKAQIKREDDERIEREKEAAEAATGGGGSGSATGSRADLLKAAYSQIGVPYVYGAYQPGVALDCSGFTKYCYSTIGISLPHSAAAQAAMARPVSYGSLQPGDLIFWIGTCPGSHSGSHVAMYLGNNTVIHADGVRVSTGGVWSDWSKVGAIL